MTSPYSPSGFLYDLLLPSIVNIRAFQNENYGKRGRKSTLLEAPSVAWLEMADEWHIVSSLRSGTRGMRAAAELYLPRYPKEGDDEWIFRLNNSFCEELLGDAVDEMIAKPFSEPVTFEGTVPDWIKELNKDVDGEGTGIQEFARSFVTEAVWWGLAHLAVDARNPPDTLPPAPLLKDFEGAFPRMRVVPGPNMLCWYRETTRGRPMREVRFYERVVDAQEIIEILHVWDAEKLVDYSRDYTSNKFENPQEETNRTGTIPIVTLYTNRTGPFTARPPYMDLAWINLDHWQSYSDQRSILHLARTPTFFRVGFTEKELRAKVAIGSRRSLGSSNPDAKASWIEVGGSSITFGKEHLQGLKDAAREKSAKPLSTRGPVTATGEISASEKATSDAQSWCEAGEVALLEAYKLAQKTVPGLEPIPDDFRVRIHKEFDLRDRSTEELSGLRSDRARGDLSRETIWSELERRGHLPKNFDPAQEKIRIEREAAEQLQLDVERTEELADAAPTPVAPGAPSPKPKAKPGSKA